MLLSSLGYSMYDYLLGFGVFVGIDCLYSLFLLFCIFLAPFTNRGLHTISLRLNSQTDRGWSKILSNSSQFTGRMLELVTKTLQRRYVKDLLRMYLFKSVGKSAPMTDTGPHEWQESKIRRTLHPREW